VWAGCREEGRDAETISTCRLLVDVAGTHGDAEICHHLHALQGMDID